jgi:hypothetical protein
MYQSIPAVPFPPGISHFWKGNGYVPTPRKKIGSISPPPDNNISKKNVEFSQRMSVKPNANKFNIFPVNLPNPP